MLRLVTLVIASLLAMELVVWLAAVVDARDAGAEVPDGTTIAAGIAIAVLYPLGGLVVLGRPVLAALLFILAAVLAFLFGHEDGPDGLAGYGVLALPLAAASAISARWRHLPWLTNGRGG
jgi:hypothetical protein